MGPLLETMGRYEVTIEKPEEGKGDTEKDDNTGVLPERLCTPLTDAAKRLINDNIRGSTKKAYMSKVKAFATYCMKEGTNTKSCHPNVVINYLTTLALEKGLSYQTICRYRSAITKQHIGVDGTPLWMIPEIKQLVRAMFINRPLFPRYTDTWDVIGCSNTSRPDQA